MEGTATSIKSIDMAASTYRKSGNVLSTLKGYVNKLANFEYGSLSGVTITQNEISKSVLQIAINPAKTSLNQWIEIAKAYKYANHKSIDFSLKFFK